jgi:iron complex transport system permease protein
VLARRLRPLELGPDLAAGLGVRGERTRLGLLLVAVGLAAVATAAAGPVAFVAFLSAPLARRLVRGPAPLPVVALTGALLVLGADLVAGRIVPGATLPVGIVTGAIGAPFLLSLLVGADRFGRRRAPAHS